MGPTQLGKELQAWLQLTWQNPDLLTQITIRHLGGQRFEVETQEGGG